MIPSDMTPEKADFMARCFVNGSEKHSKSEKVEPISGEWSVRFQSHPYVMQAEAEGWGLELRMSCIGAARERIMAGVKPINMKPQDVMPKPEYVAYWKDQARREREATEWRRANPDHPSIKGLVEIDPEALLRRLGINRPE